MKKIRLLVGVLVLFATCVTAPSGMAQTNDMVGTVTYPPKGSCFLRGHTYTIKWSVSGSASAVAGVDKTVPVKACITNPFGDSGFTCPSLMITNSVGDGFTWTVPTNSIVVSKDGFVPMPDGTYWLTLVAMDPHVHITDDAKYFFSIASSEGSPR